MEMSYLQTIPHPHADLTLMSGAELFMREDVGLTDAEVEVLAGSMNVFMLASTLAAGWVADHLGRRRTLVLANAFLMAGALAMSLGTSFAALMAARFVTSLGSGLARVVAPVYNAEISPASTRGALSSMLDVRTYAHPSVCCILVLDHVTVTLT
jgi:MFS family permease